MNENKFFNNAPDDLAQNLAAIDEPGGPEHFNYYPWGWTHAGNTPFRRWKRETYRGGVADPFIASWPKGITARGEIRSQYCHAVDMVPTVPDALGLEPPEKIRGVTQSPIQGFSLKSSFEDAEAPALHVTQHFEMFGHRSLYHDGWRAVCPWPGRSFAEGIPFGAPIDKDKLVELDAHNWVLYNLAEDFAETTNLAEKERDRLISMIAMWYVEAGKYGVLPIDGRGQLRFLEEKPQIAPPRKRYFSYPGTQAIPPERPAAAHERAPVMEENEYNAPFPLAGTVKKVLVDVSGEAVEDQAAKMREYLARQQGPARPVPNTEPAAACLDRRLRVS